MLMECDHSEAHYSLRFIPRAIEPPLDVEWLAEWLGIEVEVRPLPSSVAGFYMYTCNRPHAVINSKDSAERRRWTLAHEIAHHLMSMVSPADTIFELYPKKKSSKSKPADVSRQPHECADEKDRHQSSAVQNERVCDRFAAELLMPTHLVRRLAVEVKHGPFDKTALLANRFEVSVMAMRIRLRELGLSYKRR